MDWNTSQRLSPCPELYYPSLAHLSLPIGVCATPEHWLYCNAALQQRVTPSDTIAANLGLDAALWQQVWRCIIRHRHYHALDVPLSDALNAYILVSQQFRDSHNHPIYLLEFQHKAQFLHRFWQQSLHATLQQQQQRQALHMAQQMHSALHLSKTDSLTGIANRRAFDQYLQQIWHQTTDTAEPLSLILVDIDFFKDINDCLGHDHGDWVLHEVAQSLAYGINRSRDLVARIGGEEFGIILPDTTFEGLQIVAAHLLQRIRALNIPHPTAKTAPMVTVSMGGCTVHHRLAQHSPALLLRCADQALYQCKQHGRNQMCCVALSSALEADL